MRMSGILQNLNKNYTDEGKAKATKLADGLTGQLFKDVYLMNPIPRTDF